VFGKFQRLRQNTMRPANDQQPHIVGLCRIVIVMFKQIKNQRSTQSISVSLRYVNFQPSIPATASLRRSFALLPLFGSHAKGDIYLSHSTSSSSFRHRSTVIALKLIIVVDIHVSHHLSRTKTTQRDGRDL
jgi:hypothetical protein